MKFEIDDLSKILNSLNLNSLSQCEIARKLNVSRKQVKFVIDNIYGKNIELLEFTQQPCLYCKIIKKMCCFEKDNASRYYEICTDCWNIILQKVSKLFGDGLGTRAIGKELGLDRHYIKVAFDVLGLKNKVGRQYKCLEEKQCNGVCGRIKPINEFSKCGKTKNGCTKYNSQCKECFNRYQNSKRKKKSIENNKYTTDFLNKVEELFNNGFGKIRIAKQLSVNKGVVLTAYKKLGLYKSERTMNKQNPRTVHLKTEKYCKDCGKSLPIEFFSCYFDNAGRKRIKFVCKEHELQRNNERIAIKYKTDINFKFARIITGIIRKKIKEFAINNICSISKYVNINVTEYVSHIEKQFEPWMNWNNWGKYNAKTWDDNDPSTWTWQLDHIIPQSDLPFDSLEHPNFKKCWALENLRPLSAKQNILDGAKKTRHKK